MNLRDAETCASSDSLKRNGAARRVLAYELLLQRPARFDGAEVGRVWRQVEDANTARRGECDDARILVRSEIVHHQDVPATELRQEGTAQPLHEARLVHRREGTALHDPPAQAHGADHGEVGAPVRRRALDELAALGNPRVASRHRSVESRLVEKHQPSRIDPRDESQVGAPLLGDVETQLLQRADPLFFTTYPRRRSARFMLETWTR